MAILSDPSRSNNALNTTQDFFWQTLVNRNNLRLKIKQTGSELLQNKNMTVKMSSMFDMLVKRANNDSSKIFTNSKLYTCQSFMYKSTSV